MTVNLRGVPPLQWRPSTLGAVAVAFSWSALVLFAVLLPIKFVFVGAIRSAPFFGVQPDAADRAATEACFVAASSFATAVALLVIVITLLFHFAGRRFINGWIVSSFAAVLSGLLWLLVISHD